MRKWNVLHDGFVAAGKDPLGGGRVVITNLVKGMLQPLIKSLIALFAQ